MTVKNIKPNHVIPAILLSIVKMAVVPVVIGVAWTWYYNTYKKPEQMKQSAEQKKAYDLCLKSAGDTKAEILGCNTKFPDIAFPVTTILK